MEIIRKAALLWTTRATFTVPPSMVAWLVAQLYFMIRAAERCSRSIPQAKRPCCTASPPLTETGRIPPLA